MHTVSMSAFFFADVDRIRILVEQGYLKKLRPELWKGRTVKKYTNLEDFAGFHEI